MKGLPESRSWFQIDSDGTKHVIEKMDKYRFHIAQKIYEELAQNPDTISKGLAH